MIRQTDHTMPACDPSSCAGTVPARDRLRIVLQYSGERSYNALALRLGLKRSENLYRIRKGYNGISMDLALRIRNICPSLSLSWLLGGEGDPEAPDPDFCRGRFRRGALPSALSRPALFGPGLSAWEGSTNSVSFLAVSRGRGGRFLLQRRAVAPSPARRLHASRPDARPSPIVFGRAYVVVVGEARLCRIIRKGESPERVRLVSLKPGKYDEIAVPRTEIDGLYRICGTFRYWAD